MDNCADYLTRVYYIAPKPFKMILLDTTFLMPDTIQAIHMTVNNTSTGMATRDWIVLGSAICTLILGVMTFRLGKKIMVNEVRKLQVQSMRKLKRILEDQVYFYYDRPRGGGDVHGIFFKEHFLAKNFLKGMDYILNKDIIYMFADYEEQFKFVKMMDDENLPGKILKILRKFRRTNPNIDIIEEMIPNKERSDRRKTDFRKRFIVFAGKRTMNVGEHNCFVLDDLYLPKDFFEALRELYQQVDKWLKKARIFDHI